MSAPYRKKVASVANDTISSVELKPRFEGKYNAFRWDKVEVVIPDHAGLADGDYIILDLSNKDNNGNALADLLTLDDDDVIERLGKKWEALGTNGNMIKVDDPSLFPLIFDFKHGFQLESDAYLNILVHGLAANRDVYIVMWGNPVSLPQIRIDLIKKGLPV
ncbi:MAG: hypothetical protein P8Y97_21270 [Candidatus Lokiarchaeota archaeon]